MVTLFMSQSVYVTPQRTGDDDDNAVLKKVLQKRQDKETVS